MKGLNLVVTCPFCGVGIELGGPWLGRRMQLRWIRLMCQSILLAVDLLLLLFPVQMEMNRHGETIGVYHGFLFCWSPGCNRQNFDNALFWANVERVDTFVIPLGSVMIK